MKQIKISLILALTILFLGAIGQASSLKFGGPINGEQSSIDSTATGFATLTLDAETNTFELSIHISGLENELTASHIHTGAAGVDGPVIVPIGDMTDYSVMGDFYSHVAMDVPFPPEELVNLLSGNTYVNFHTDVYGGGEVRGQLNPLEMESDSILNMSTRGTVDPGEGEAGLLIGGVVLQKPKTILFRMVAESLVDSGVETPLEDSSFEIFKLDSGEPGTAELIGGNDNWKEDGQEFRISMTGLAPGFDSESAAILTLEPGSYTLNANSEQGAGIALVETYGVAPKTIAAAISFSANGSLSSEFTILNAILEATETDTLLNGPGPFTLFASTDEAFLAVFTQEDLDELLADDADQADDFDTLTAVVQGHVVGGTVLSSDLSEDASVNLTTLIGSEIEVLLSGGVITVDNTTVLEGDIESSNGVIHVIDMVVME